MNCLLSFSITLFALFIISVQLTSSANFPNPPPVPPPNASPDQWNTFWKLLHNYYAIIARPRFGKRYDAILSQSQNSSPLTLLNPNIESLPLYQSNLNDILSQSNRDAHGDQKIHFDDFYTYVPENKKRRRRR